MEESTKALLKKILVVFCFGLVACISIIFIVSTGMFLLILSILGFAAYGAFNLWEKYAKKELMKKEENLDILEE